MVIASLSGSLSGSLSASLSGSLRTMYASLRIVVGSRSVSRTASLSAVLIGTFASLVGCRAPISEALPLGADNETCASCHVEQGAQFAGSAHGSSAQSPVFLALLPHVEGAWGGLARSRCTQCHAPSHVPPAEAEAPHAGLQCVSCHAAIGNRGTRDGRLVIDLNAPLDGPFGDGQSSAHASQSRGFLSDAQLCLTCHEVTGPQLFVESSAAEFEQAVARVDAPQCITCHMPSLEPGSIAQGSDRVRPRRSHAFIGPTPPAETDADSLAEYADSLRSLFGQERVLLELVREGDALAVSLTNARLGHDLPTGSAFLRQLRVDVHFEVGAEVVEVPRVIELGDQPFQGETARALPTDANRIVHVRIAPGESEHARVVIPPGATRATASLSLRAYRDTVLDALLDALGEEERARLRVEVVVLESSLALADSP